MGLWDKLLEALGFGGTRGTDRASSKTTKPSDETNPRRPPKHETGSVLAGNVEHVDDKFAIVTSRAARAIVFVDEMADRRVERATDVVSVGDAVEFMLLRPNDRRPGEWVGSLSAVAEARAREALSSIEPDDRVTGRVDAIHDRGVSVRCKDFKVWVPLTELAWAWVEHPSDVVRLKQTVTVAIVRIELPEGWLTDKRARRAQAVGSLRACEEKPASPEVRMAFSCLPFKVWSVARAPRSCDPVVLHVLEEIVDGRGAAEIAAATGLPGAALDKVLDALESEQLVKGRRPTAKGRGLVEALRRAKGLNAESPRGLFASAAHPTAQFLPSTAVTSREYPRGWPRPPFDQQAEDAFHRATDEAIPEMLLTQVVEESRRAVIAEMQNDERLRVFLRRDGEVPWRAAFIGVPEHWVLAGLWSALEPVGVSPYRPAPSERGCRAFLMIEVQARLRGKTSRDTVPLYWEPATRTYWAPRSDHGLRLRERREQEFPELPSPVGTQLPGGDVVVGVSGRRWCIVEVNRGR